MTEEEKELVKNGIIRKNPEKKVKDLLDWIVAIRRHINHKVQLIEKTVSDRIRSSAYQDEFDDNVDISNIFFRIQ